MHFIKFFAAIVLLTPFGAMASADWPNEPAGSTKVLDWPFDQTQNGKGAGYVWDVYSSGRIVSDPTAPLSPSNVMKSSIAAGATSGGVQLEYVTPQFHNELFVGFYWKTNAQFEGRTSANKLFFIRGPEGNGFWGLGGSPGDPTGNIYFGHNTAGIDNSHTCQADLGLICGPNVNNKVVTKGIWTKIEAYVKKSTTATSRDGIVRWWVDGVLVGNYTNMNYAASGLNEWLWSETWDGTVTNPTPSVEWAHYLDHLYISAPNCGPSGCAAPPYLVIKSSLSSGRTGVPYSATLSADGGTKPYTWFIESGNLPSGLSLNKNTGVISGSPTCVGRSDFTIRVADGSSPALSATKAYSLVTSGTGTPCSATSIGFSQSTTRQSRFAACVSGNKVNIRLPANGNGAFRISIFDLSGKKLFDKISAGRNEISIAADFKNGVYVARLIHGSTVESTRFQVIN